MTSETLICLQSLERITRRHVYLNVIKYKTHFNTSKQTNKQASKQTTVYDLNIGAP